jgi:hypothetical protein
MRRGQAALEFMMTYGWAILVVLAAIGALSYFGVLNPSKLTPDTCLTSSGFGCTGKPYISAATNQIAFTVVNGFGYAVAFDSANAVLSDSLGDLGCTTVLFCDRGDTATCTDPRTVQDGATVTLAIDGCTLTEGEVVRGDVTMTFDNVQTGFTDVVTFTAGGKVRP